MIPTEQHQEAQSALKELEHVNIPPELRYLSSRYNSLSQQLLNALDGMDTALQEASAFISRNQLGNARVRLREAEANLNNAQSLLSEIQAATAAATTSFSVLAPYAADRLQNVYQRMRQSLLRLNQLINELNWRSQDISASEMAQAAKLALTDLTTNVNSLSGFVGDALTVSGKLSSNGKPLPNRPLTIYLDVTTITTTTNNDGSFTTRVTIPDRFVTKMDLRAQYVPSGDDSRTYQASESLPMEIKTLFHTTQLDVFVPPVVAPGILFTISGQVSSAGSNSDRTLKVLLDGTPLATATVTQDFQLEVTAPENTPLGKHILTVVAISQGRDAEATRKLSLNVSGLLLDIETRLPSLVFTPASIQINGKIGARIKPGTRVNLIFRGAASTVNTAPDGSFNTNLEIPLNLSIIGPQELTIAVVPAETSYAPREEKLWIFAINPIYAGLMLMVLLAVGLFAYRQTRASVVLSPGEVEIAATQVATPPTPQPPHEIPGARGRILLAYAASLRAVETSLGRRMTPETTLREFLIMATARLPARAIDPFAALTAHAEVALYSPRELDDTAVAITEESATTLKKELSGVPA